MSSLSRIRSHNNHITIHAHASQGVHTMLPISWPVSVVLAALLSLIHLSHRIASNAPGFPELFVEQVGTGAIQ